MGQESPFHANNRAGAVKPSVGRNKDNCSFMTLGKKPAPGIFNLLESGHVWSARKSSTCQIVINVVLVIFGCLSDPSSRYFSICFILNVGVSLLSIA